MDGCWVFWASSRYFSRHKKPFLDQVDGSSTPRDPRTTGVAPITSETQSVQVPWNHSQGDWIPRVWYIYLHLVEIIWLMFFPILLDFVGNQEPGGFKEFCLPLLTATFCLYPIWRTYNFFHQLYSNGPRKLREYMDASSWLCPITTGVICGVPLGLYQHFFIYSD